MLSGTKINFERRRKPSRTKIASLKGCACTMPSIPSSRCLGYWNSHQNSCRNVESHLGLWHGCIITHWQQNSQMPLIRFRDWAESLGWGTSLLYNQRCAICRNSLCNNSRVRSCMGWEISCLMSPRKWQVLLLASHTGSFMAIGLSAAVWKDVGNCCRGCLEWAPMSQAQKRIATC